MSSETPSMSVTPGFEAMSHEDGFAIIDAFYGTEDTASPAQEADWARPAIAYHDTRDDSGRQHLQQSSPAISVQEARDPASSGYSRFGTPAESGQSFLVTSYQFKSHPVSPEGRVVQHDYRNLFRKDENGWACLQCGAIVKLNSRTGHYESHFPENLRCPVQSCEQNIKRRHPLVNHLRTHDLSERAKCPACPLVVSLALLRIHVQKDHSHDLEPYTKEVCSLLQAFIEYIKKSERCPVRGCTRAHKGCGDQLDAIREHGGDLSMSQIEDLESKHFFPF